MFAKIPKWAWYAGAVILVLAVALFGFTDILPR